MQMWLAETAVHGHSNTESGTLTKVCTSPTQLGHAAAANLPLQT